MSSEAEDTTKSTGSAPRLESIHRVMNIPVVQSAIERTNSTYSYVKDSHHLINWALNYAEYGLNCATASAAPVAGPLAKKFEDQISSVDQKLCQGLDAVEQKLPIVKQPTDQVYEAAKKIMNTSLQPTIEKFVSAKESAANRAALFKEILNVDYASLAVQGVDNTSDLVNRLLDHFFPPVPGTEEETPGTFFFFFLFYILFICIYNRRYIHFFFCFITYIN